MRSTSTAAAQGVRGVEVWGGTGKAEYGYDEINLNCGCPRWAAAWGGGEDEEGAVRCGGDLMLQSPLDTSRPSLTLPPPPSQ